MHTQHFDFYVSINTIEKVRMEIMHAAVLKIFCATSFVILRVDDLLLNDEIHVIVN